MNENCTACGACADAVQPEVQNPFNYGLNKMKAAYLPHAMAYPQRYVLDPSIIGTPEADKAKAACKYGAIDLDMKEETISHQGRRGGLGHRLAAVRRGQDPALRLRPVRQCDHQRSSSSASPIRTARPAARSCGPSDGKEAQERRLHPVRRFARREPSAPLLAHLLHGLAQTNPLRARGIRRRAKSTIYYIDIRAIDRFEDFYQKVQADAKVSFVKSKVAQHHAG